jgi:hypothetical protein
MPTFLSWSTLSLPRIFYFLNPNESDALVSMRSNQALQTPSTQTNLLASALFSCYRSYSRLLRQEPAFVRKPPGPTLSGAPRERARKL